MPEQRALPTPHLRLFTRDSILGILRNPIPAFYWWRFLRRLPREEANNLEFDRRHGVDTAGDLILQAAGVDSKDIDRGHGVYRGIWASTFFDIMNGSGLDFSRFAFVDYGSGKGKALLLASNYPFRAIHGVEFSPILHQIAEKNCASYQSPDKKCDKITPTLGDALLYEVPQHDPLVTFFFNPFDTDTTRAVLKRLYDSYRENRRDIYVIYVNLRHIRENMDIFRSIPWLHLERRDSKHVIFKIGDP